MEKVSNQQPIMQRTVKFLERYGMKVVFLAERAKIQKNVLSSFINGHSALYEPQYNRLIAFMDEWDRRMVGFTALDN